MGNFQWKECGIRCKSTDKECKALENYIKERLEFMPKIAIHDNIQANSFEDSLEVGYMKERKNKLQNARDTLSKPSVISRQPDVFSQNNREYVLNPRDLPYGEGSDEKYSVNKLDNNLEFRKNVEQMNDPIKSDRGSYINSVSQEPQNNLIQRLHSKESNDLKRKDSDEWVN